MRLIYKREVVTASQNDPQTCCVCGEEFNGAEYVHCGGCGDVVCNNPECWALDGERCNFCEMDDES